jgi:hypothetical protein
VEPVELLQLANELARRAEGEPGDAAPAVLAAHAALEATVNRLGGVEIHSFNYRARFLPKWHDLCQRVRGGSSRPPPTLSACKPSGTPSSDTAESPSGWTAAPPPRRPKFPPTLPTRRRLGGPWRRPGG